MLLWLLVDACEGDLGKNEGAAYNQKDSQGREESETGQGSKAAVERDQSVNRQCETETNPQSKDSSGGTVGKENSQTKESKAKKTKGVDSETGASKEKVAIRKMVKSDVKNVQAKVSFGMILVNI